MDWRWLISHREQAQSVRFWADPLPPLPFEADHMTVDLSNAVFFDLEIRKTVEESGGWEGAKTSGGVGLLCLWSEAEGRPHFFDDHDLIEAVQMLENAELLVSFNGLSFDMRVLESTWGGPIHTKAHWDVFESVKESLNRKNLPWKGNGLDALCKETLGEGKICSGEKAPLLLRDGQLAKLVNYCLSDVLLTRSLAKFASQNGFVRTFGGRMLDLDLERVCQSR